ncbi:MAG: diguanylate cyclase, partial [Sulfurimonas sp. RIFCSPLOWO2_12_FULL_34_6]
MIKKSEQKKLIIKVIVVILLALVPLSALRVLLVYDDFTYIIFFKELIFSVISALVVASILYLITKKEIRKINAKARSYAFTDGLTGLYNRHYLNDFLLKFKILRKEGSVFAIAFIDIDKFKEINDTLGHEAGDCILKCLALKLKSLTRTTDTLCRYGGEEFVIIYNDIAKDDIL